MVGFEKRQVLSMTRMNFFPSIEADMLGLVNASVLRQMILKTVNNNLRRGDHVFAEKTAILECTSVTAESLLSAKAGRRNIIF